MNQTTRYCSTCGALLTASAALCGECGARYRHSPYERRATDAPGAWAPPPRRASRDLGADPQEQREETEIQLITAADLEPPRPGATQLRPADQYDRTMTQQSNAPQHDIQGYTGPSVPAPADAAAPVPPRSARPVLEPPLDGCVPASFAKRALAALIDAVISTITTVPLVIGVLMVIGSESPSLTAQILVGVGVALPLACAIVLIWLQGAKGFLPGKLLMRLRVTRFAAGGPIGFARSLGRWLLYGLAPWLMWISVPLDPKKALRGLHDRAVGSVVVDVSAGRDPMLPRPDDFERPSPDHYLGERSVAVTTNENLLATPGAAWSAPSAPAPSADPAPAQQAPAIDPWAPAPVTPAPQAPPVTSVPQASPVPGPSAPSAPPAPWQEPQGWSEPPAEPWQTVPPVPSGGHETTWQTMPAAPPAPSAASEGEIDESTRVTRPDDDLEDLEQTRLSPRRRVAARLRITLEDGTVHVLDDAAVLGRNPAQDAAPIALALRDETRSMSKTHARIDGTGAEVLVTDLGSTNGTTVVHADGRREDAAPGAPVVVPDGAVLELGELTLTVERLA